MIIMCFYKSYYKFIKLNEKYFCFLTILVTFNRQILLLFIHSKEIMIKFLKKLLKQAILWAKKRYFKGRFL